MSTNQDISVEPDMNLVEKELQELKRLYRLAPFPYIIINSNGLIIECNDCASALFGCELQHILHKSLQSFIIDDDKSRFNDFLSIVRNTRVVQSCELSIIKPQASSTIAICSAYFDPYQKEEFSQIYIAFIDTSLGDTSKTRIHHDQNITFIADLIERSTHPFAVANPNGQIRICNTSFEALLGYTSDELSRIDWARDLTPDEWKEHERQKLNELHRTGKPVQYEKEYIRKDGTRIPVELFVHLVTDNDGTPQYYYSFISDISERKRTESRLRESEERFAQLADNVDQVFWFTSINPEKVLYVNPAFERIWGVPAQELYKNARLWTDHIHPDDKNRVTEAFSDWVKGKSSHYNVEYSILNHQGKLRWIHDRGAALIKKDGEVIQVSGIAEDITPLKLKDIPS